MLGDVILREVGGIDEGVGHVIAAETPSETRTIASRWTIGGDVCGVVVGGFRRIGRVFCVLFGRFFGGGGDIDGHRLGWVCVNGNFVFDDEWGYVIGVGISGDFRIGDLGIRCNGRG